MSKVCPSNLSTIDADHVDHSNDHHNDTEQLKQCRICLQNTFPLIIPCKCTGTVKYVHQDCLKQWSNQVIKRKLKQQQQNGQYQTLTSIQCQLCKQNIDLKVQWNNINLTFYEAFQRNQDYFWPIFLINFFVGLICIGCIIFALVTLIMVVTKNPLVDYQKFSTDPYLSWGTLSIAFAAGIIFLVKAGCDLHNMFIQKQFSIQGVVSKEIIYGQNQNKQFIQNNSDQIRSINEFKVQVETSNATINNAFNFSKKRISATIQHSQQTVHEIIIPNRSHILSHKKLPPLSKFIPNT